MVNSSIHSGSEPVKRSTTPGDKYIPPHRRKKESGPVEEIFNESMSEIGKPSLVDEAHLTELIKKAKRFQSLVDIFSTYSPQFNPIHINCFLSTLAKRKCVDASQKEFILNDMQPLIVKKIAEFSPRQICNLCWSIGKITQERTPLTQILSKTFSEGRMWKDVKRADELAMLLNGLTDMQSKNQFIAQKINSHIVYHPLLISAPTTSLGAISLLAKGLENHQALTQPALELMIRSFLEKDGINRASNTEMVLFLKTLVAKGYFDKDLYNRIIENMVESRLQSGTNSLWYFIAIANSFTDIRYDHPVLLNLLSEYTEPDRLRDFHDFDLPNVAMIIAELSPESSFDKIAAILKEMQTRWHGHYHKYGIDNFLQTCRALACTKKTEDSSFLQAIEFTLKLAEQNFDTLNSKDKSQLHQIAIQAGHKDIIARLESENHIFHHSTMANEAQRNIAEKLRALGYQVTLEKNVRGFYVDIFLENIVCDGLPVIIEVDSAYRFTRSGRETGSTLLQSQILRKLGYCLFRANVTSDEHLNSQVERICQKLPRPAPRFLRTALMEPKGP